MPRKRQLIQYSSIDDYVIVGMYSIRPFVIRTLAGSPALLLAAAFLHAAATTAPSAATVRGTVWLVTLAAICLWAFWLTIAEKRPRITPSSAEFITMRGYRSAVTVHVVELQTILNTADDVHRMPYRLRRKIRRTVLQTRYVSTLLLLAARIETQAADSWWERVQLDNGDDLHHTLTEQDSKLIGMRREILHELRSKSKPVVV